MTGTHRLKVGTTLVGREQESKALTSLFDKVNIRNAPSETCLIHGAPGSGKTHTVLQVAKKYLEETPVIQKKFQNGYFLYGKVDQYRDFSSPYSEIVAAFDQLVEKGAPKDRIRKCTRTEARILTRLIPSFRNLMDDTADAATATTTSSTHVTASRDNSNSDKQEQHSDPHDDAILTLAFERLVVAFRVFLAKFCCQEHPLILAIDDLQWADEDSIRLLGRIANDTSITNFLFLGLHRDDGADNFDLGLSKSHMDLPIGPLSVDDVDSLVGMMVEVDQSGGASTMSADLSFLVHRKTLGNPYFVVQFLEMLHDRQLLKYNYRSAKWEWIISAIAEATDVSENVVDILKTRISRLEPQVQRILIVASFLGFMVDTVLLEFLIQELGTMDRLRFHAEKQTNGHKGGTKPQQEQQVTTIMPISRALKQAEEDGLVEMEPDGTICRFSHDRIRECFYALIPEGEAQDHLHYEIGTRVWRRYKESDPAYVFLAADQLNRGASHISGDVDRLFLIQLNYKASQTAKSKVGTETVRMFIEKAIEQVSTLDHLMGHWEEHYNLFIDLYSFAAEVEFSRGDFNRSEGHIDTVLAHARQRPDAVRALVSRALAHGVRRDFVQGIKESRKLLELLGIKMSRSLTPSFLVELFKTKNALKNKTDKDILQMSDMDSQNMVLAMKILQHGSIYGWNSDTTFAGLCYLRMIRLTVKNGWCEATPYALAGYGFMLAALGEEAEAFRFSQLAIRASRSRRALPEVNMMVHAFLAHFERPAAQSLPPLLAGYRSGLETGDMMCGTICMSVYAHVYLFSGLALPSFAIDLLQFAQQLKLCRQDLALAFVLPALQLALNLTGKTSDPMDVSKESMRHLDGFSDNMFIATSIEDPSVLFVYYLQAFSAYLLDDMDSAQQALDRVYALKNKRLDGTQILNIFFLLVDGLISFALRRQKPKGSKHRHLAKVSIRELKALSKKRSINCGGILALLEAEQDSFSEKKVEVLRNKYSYAIRQLSRSGFLHFTAIANELAGEKMMAMKDEYWKEFYLSQAWNSYDDWGAVVKVEKMKKEFPTLDFKRSKSFVSSGSFHSSYKYDKNIDSIDSLQKSRNCFVQSTLRESRSTEFMSNEFAIEEES